MWATDFFTNTLTGISEGGVMRKLAVPFDCSGWLLSAKGALFKGSYECEPSSSSGVYRADVREAAGAVTGVGETGGTPIDYEVVGHELWVSRREGGIRRLGLPRLQPVGVLNHGNSFLVPDHFGRVWAGIVEKSGASVIPWKPQR